MEQQSFDPEQFRVELREPQQKPRPARRPQTSRQTKNWTTQGWFLKGPISGPWLQAAARLPGRSLHVGLAIWFLRGVKKQDQVKLTSKTRDLFSIRQDASRRGLKQLEKAGLVAADRKQGCAPAITILKPHCPLNGKEQQKEDK